MSGLIGSAYQASKWSDRLRSMVPVFCNSPADYTAKILQGDVYFPQVEFLDSVIKAFDGSTSNPGSITSAFTLIDRSGKGWLGAIFLPRMAAGPILLTIIIDGGSRTFTINPPNNQSNVIVVPDMIGNIGCGDYTYAQNTSGVIFIDGVSKFKIYSIRDYVSRGSAVKFERSLVVRVQSSSSIITAACGVQCQLE